MSEANRWARQRVDERPWPLPPEQRRRGRWIALAVLGVAVVVLAVAGNEWRVERKSDRLRREASALIGALDPPDWMVEVDRDEIGFHCHVWSGCQERYMSVTYQIDVGRASAVDRANPCPALRSALSGWTIQHAPPDQCEIVASLDGITMTAFLSADGFAPLKHGVALDQAERAYLSVYP